MKKLMILVLATLTSTVAMANPRMSCERRLESSERENRYLREEIESLRRESGGSHNRDRICTVLVDDGTNFTNIQAHPDSTHGFGTIINGTQVRDSGERAINPKYPNLVLAYVSVIYTPPAPYDPQGPGVSGWIVLRFMSCHR